MSRKVAPDFQKLICVVLAVLGFFFPSSSVFFNNKHYILQHCMKPLIIAPPLVVLEKPAPATCHSVTLAVMFESVRFYKLPLWSYGETGRQVNC